MSDKIFIPFTEALVEDGATPPGDLVPYQMAYRCVRLLDGTYDFRNVPAESGAVAVKIELRSGKDLISGGHLGHAA